ncbi:hypothetical protein GQ53DRAFT_758985 [Thozetella sp. PMI_491]|nr:hypothetical protein GQ53DRAFT_758985 [Thozetella sp. PMI_491]
MASPSDRGTVITADLEWADEDGESLTLPARIAKKEATGMSVTLEQQVVSHGYWLDSEDLAAAGNSRATLLIYEVSLYPPNARNNRRFKSVVVNLQFSTTDKNPTTWPEVDNWAPGRHGAIKVDPKDFQHSSGTQTQLKVGAKHKDVPLFGEWSKHWTSKNEGLKEYRVMIAGKHDHPAGCPNYNEVEWTASESPVQHEMMDRFGLAILLKRSSEAFQVDVKFEVDIDWKFSLVTALKKADPRKLVGRAKSTCYTGKDEENAFLGLWPKQVPELDNILKGRNLSLLSTTMTGDKLQDLALLHVPELGTITKMYGVAGEVGSPAEGGTDEGKADSKEAEDGDEAEEGDDGDEDERTRDEEDTATDDDDDSASSQANAGVDDDGDDDDDDDDDDDGGAALL